MGIPHALFLVPLLAVVTKAQQRLNLSCYDTQFQSPLTVAFDQLDWHNLEHKLRSFKRSKTRSDYCVLILGMDYDHRKLQISCNPVSTSQYYNVHQYGVSAQLTVKASFPYQNKNSTSWISIEFICSTSDGCTHAYIERLIKEEQSWQKIISEKSRVHLTDELERILYRTPPKVPNYRLQCHNGRGTGKCKPDEAMCTATLRDDEWRSGICIGGPIRMAFDMKWSAVAKTAASNENLGWATIEKEISYGCNHDKCNYKGLIVEQVKKIAKDWDVMGAFFDEVFLKDQQTAEEEMEDWSSISSVASSPSSKKTSTRIPTMSRLNSSTNPYIAMNSRLTMSQLYCFFAFVAQQMMKWIVHR